MAADEPTLRIAAFSVAELCGAADPLADFADPHGYLRGFEGSGRNLLADNPWSRPEDLALILVLDGAIVVGRLGFFAGPGPRGGSAPERVLWLSGYFLQDRYRASGAGGMLMLRALSSRVPLLAAGGPNADLQKLYDSTRFQRLAPLTGWYWFYRSGPILGRLRNPVFRTLARLPVALLLVVWRLVHRPVTTAQLRFEAVTEFPPAIDALQAADARVLFVRDHRLLNWLLRNRPSTRGFLIHRGHELVGHCVLGTRRLSRTDSDQAWGMLVDFHLRADGGGHDELLGFGVQYFREKGLDLFHCQAADSALAAAARRAGLRSHGGSLVFYRGGRHRVDEHQDWRFSAATADLTLYVD